MLLELLLPGRGLLQVQSQLFPEFFVSRLQVIFFLVLLEHGEAPIMVLEPMNPLDEVGQELRQDGKQNLIILRAGQTPVSLAGDGNLAFPFQQGGNDGVHTSRMPG